MPSKITLSLTGIPLANSFVEIRLGALNNLKETFKTSRLASYESAIGVNTENTLLNLYNALRADYNLGSLYIIEINGISSELSITHPDFGYFTTALFNDNTGLFLKNIVNTADPIRITVDSAVLSEADTNPCSLVKMNVTTSSLATTYKINGGALINNAVNPFSFDTARGTIVRVDIFDNEGNTSFKNLSTGDILLSSNLTVSYLNSPSGATLTASMTNTNLLTVTYSLDNITFQESGTFSGLLAGNYTVYVKDQLGCTVSKTVTIEDFNNTGVLERQPYSDLPSKSNSIRFSKYIEHGTSSGYKNDENTLSCQLPYTNVVNEYNQLFNNSDFITTQIKTNYRDNVVTIIEEDGTETQVGIIQKSNNSGLEDTRDAISYSLSEGTQTGLYFSELNGNLPQWGVIGNYVFFNFAWYEIVSIVFDDSKNAYILIINTPYPFVPEESLVEVSSVYNLEKYEIFEFNINMASFSDRKIQVNITQNDDNASFIEQIYLSEIISVKDSHPNTLCIDYYNDENTDIFYATGIRNKIRTPIEYFGGGYIDNTDSERTDNTTYLINAENYETDLIAFKLVPKEIMRKIVQALSHKFVFLNEVQYTKEDSPEITPLIGSNLYRINAQMTKSNGVYTSNGIGETFNIDTGIEIPSLISVNSEGYLKIK